ncbi:13220_t:CDS:2, partial [Cetraspora pellucida]
QQNISKEDYEYVQKIWQIFEIQTFEDYYDLYLKTDVLLLANVFINYTIMCLKDDDLDLLHYVLVLEMFNDSLYKSSRTKLKLMTNMNEYLMVKERIHEGITMASHWFAKANNPQYSDYNPSKPISWIMYEDINALYFNAMTQYISIKILEKIVLSASHNLKTSDDLDSKDSKKKHNIQKAK